jgi:hypothetical protein
MGTENFNMRYLQSQLPQKMLEEKCHYVAGIVMTPKSYLPQIKRTYLT